MTLVEVVLAVVILAVGLLALVGTGVAVTRMLAQGRRYHRASALATELLEILHSRSCSRIVNGSETREAHTAAWTVTDAGNEKRVILTVASGEGGNARQDVFHTLIPCAP